jgi:GNAT superfamily N-acetyltransferase
MLNKIFPYKSDQMNVRYSLPDSLGKVAYGQSYWVAADEAQSVIGITGLYADRNDSTFIWLGWYGVNPVNRKQGIGSMLLQFAIDEAMRRGVSTLKLYTSSDPNEQAAHQLYKKFGFQQTGIDKKSDKLFFEKNLR